MGYVFWSRLGNLTANDTRHRSLEAKKPTCVRNNVVGITPYMTRSSISARQPGHSDGHQHYEVEF